ncbi:hypothetical protein Ddc_23917 [Ditylenchus destructor]|nr:hypothetical protein Ddc_23917 [Ditylenchus destructor]
MRPYLGQTVRIEKTWIYLDVGTTYNPEHIEQMESIAHLWCDRKISVWNGGSGIVAEDIQLILDSPTILQCRYLFMHRAHFSFKDYKILYNAKIIEIYYEIDYPYKYDHDYWPQFLEQPGTFSSAVSPNAFKIVFAQNRKPLTEFRKTNETSGEKLELKKGLPTEYQNENLDRFYNRKYFNYTLERSSI